MFSVRMVRKIIIVYRRQAGICLHKFFKHKIYIQFHVLYITFYLFFIILFIAFAVLTEKKWGVVFELWLQVRIYDSSLRCCFYFYIFLPLLYICQTRLYMQFCVQIPKYDVVYSWNMDLKEQCSINCTLGGCEKNNIRDWRRMMREYYRACYF